MFGRPLSKCPACEKRFGVKRVRLTLVESDKKMEREVANVPIGSPRRGGPPIFTQTTVDVMFTRNAYDVAYVCSKCGHSWTERRVKVSKG